MAGYFPALPTNLLYDYRIDFGDVQVMANDWLLADSNSTPATDPTTANLIAHYQLEGNTNDSTFPAFNGVDYGVPTYSTDAIEGTYSIELDGVDDYVAIGGVGVDSNDPRTIAVWAKMAVPASAMTGWTNVFGFTNDLTADQGGRSFDIERRGNEDTYCLHVYGEEWNIMPLDQEWHHLAGTFDVNTVAWYGDGLQIGTTVRDVNTVDTVQMGKRGDNTEYFNGVIDDARIYDRALTAPEVAHLVDIYDSSPGDGWVHVEIDSIANLYNDEPEGLQWVNFKDFAILALDWLVKEPTWP
jgi:hypothetical protein